MSDEKFGFAVLWDDVVPSITKITGYDGRKAGRFVYTGTPCGMSSATKCRRFFETEEEAAMDALTTEMFTVERKPEVIIKLASLVLHTRGIIGNQELVASCIYARLKQLQNTLDKTYELVKQSTRSDSDGPLKINR